jgi:hypothetical protein
MQLSLFLTVALTCLEVGNGIQLQRAKPAESVIHLENKFAFTGDECSDLFHHVFDVLANHQRRVVISILTIIGMAFGATLFVGCFPFC